MPFGILALWTYRVMHVKFVYKSRTRPFLSVSVVTTAVHLTAVTAYHGTINQKRFLLFWGVACSACSAQNGTFAHRYTSLLQGPPLPSAGEEESKVIETKVDAKVSADKPG